MTPGASIPECPGCGSAQISHPVVIQDQPVILNYRFATPDDAASVPLRPIDLRECRGCGLVFNAAFEGGMVPYDSLYENRQSHSAAFARHTEKVARMIAAMMESDHPRILEVGCGKGQFLRQVVEECGGEGKGFDTSYEGPEIDGPNQFRQEYLTAAGVDGKYDAVICRHVVEHVPRIGEFLAELCRIAAACGSPEVFVETPRLEWILEHRSAWDFFYEHCNYFTEEALAGLCRNAGFRVFGQYPVFDRQYQLLVLGEPRPGQSQQPTNHREADIIGRVRSIHENSMRRLAGLVDCGGGAWAIWGAGAKGVCLANRLPTDRLVRLLDTNTAKQGFFVPGTRIPILAPSRQTLSDLSLVVIANPTYESEIRAELALHNYRGRVLVLSENLL